MASKLAWNPCDHPKKLMIFYKKTAITVCITLWHCVSCIEGSAALACLKSSLILNKQFLTLQLQMNAHAQHVHPGCIYATA